MIPNSLATAGKRAATKTSHQKCEAILSNDIFAVTRCLWRLEFKHFRQQFRRRPMVCTRETQPRIRLRDWPTGTYTYLQARADSVQTNAVIKNNGLSFAFRTIHHLPGIFCFVSFYSTRCSTSCSSNLIGNSNMQQQPHEWHFREVVALRASKLTEKNSIFVQFAN